MGVEIVAGMIFGAAIGVAGSAIQASEQRKIAKKQMAAMKDKEKLDIALQSEQAARERRAQIREARVKRASIENLAGLTGQTGSSAAIVGGQGITAQQGQNLGNINTALSGANLQSQANLNIAKAQNETSMFGGIAGSLGQMGFSMMGQSMGAGMDSIFKKP